MGISTSAGTPLPSGLNNVLPREKTCLGGMAIKRQRFKTAVQSTPTFPLLFGSTGGLAAGLLSVVRSFSAFSLTRMSPVRQGIFRELLPSCQSRCVSNCGYSCAPEALAKKRKEGDANHSSSGYWQHCGVRSGESWQCSGVNLNVNCH